MSCDILVTQEPALLEYRFLHRCVQISSDAPSFQSNKIQEPFYVGWVEGGGEETSDHSCAGALQPLLHSF
jgi:hypothetical protein